MIYKRKIGKTDIEVSELGFGCAPLGGWPVAVSDQDAKLSLETAWSRGIRYFDTAPLYGIGNGEKRYSKVLSKKPRNDKSKLPDQFKDFKVDKSSLWNKYNNLFELYDNNLYKDRGKHQVEEYFQ